MESAAKNNNDDSRNHIFVVGANSTIWDSLAIRFNGLLKLGAKTVSAGMTSVREHC